jgi:FkbM family methyltransferase
MFSDDRRTTVWERVYSEHPEFTHAHDPFDDYEAVANLVLGDCIGFKPFPGARVMDIGANVGILTSFWALNGASVRAYEADPVTYDILLSTLVSNGLTDKVEAINAAVWVCDGIVPFVGRSSSWRGMCRNGSIQSVTEEYKSLPSTANVPCISLSNALGDVVWDAVKIDIEGAEFSVLSSVSDDLLCHIRYMQIELHHDAASDAQYHKMMNKLKGIFKITGGYMDEHLDSPLKGRYHWVQLTSEVCPR